MTWTPQGAAAWRWSTRAAWASSGAMPGGMRRLSRAAARGTIGAVEPTTGGQSMPRMVIAGRAQSMSETLPSPSSDTPSSTPASARNCSGGYGSPVQVWVLSSPVIVVLPSLVAEGGQHRDQRGERVGGGAAEHAGVELGRERLDGDHDVDHAAQAHGRGRVTRPRRCRCRRPGSRRRGAGRRASGRTPRDRRCPAPPIPRPPASG